MKIRLGILASHGGSNLQAIIDHIKKEDVQIEVVAVISNNSSSFAISRAKKEGIATYHISSKTTNDVGKQMIKVFKQHKVNLIALAGYMKKIPISVLETYPNRVLNIHPALLPNYGGKGMYGMKVHEAVISANELYSGATIHLVNSQYDDGRILNQQRVAILKSDNATTLAAKILLIEHKLYFDTLKLLAEDKIVLQ